MHSIRLFSIMYVSKWLKVSQMVQNNVLHKLWAETTPIFPNKGEQAIYSFYQCTYVDILAPLIPANEF